MSWACGSRGLLRPCRSHPRWIEQGIDVLLYGRPVEPGMLPQPVCNRHCIDAGVIAHRLWQHTRLNGAPIQEHIDPLLGPPTVQVGEPEPSTGPARP